ncbi:hypothetical protein TSMEX_011181 [Taenia solium]|eukprot:TsM_000553400 transcript=TsM_000553400 gene=TsM_000553400
MRDSAAPPEANKIPCEIDVEIMPMGTSSTGICLQIEQMRCKKRPATLLRITAQINVICDAAGAFVIESQIPEHLLNPTNHYWSICCYHFEVSTRID